MALGGPGYRARGFQGTDDVMTLEERAARAERRAVQARQHAALARERAGRAAAHGRSENWTVYRREAEAHERAARINEQTAALYRRRVQRLVG